jgi:hypothetical protein
MRVRAYYVAIYESVNWAVLCGFFIWRFSLLVFECLFSLYFFEFVITYYSKIRIIPVYLNTNKQ